MLTTRDLTIDNPCNVDFRSMTRREATRRFCGDCKKYVNDLTRMTEAEAKTLLGSAPAAELCVRYLADDRGRILFLPDVPASHLSPRRRATLAAATLALATAAAGCQPVMVAGGISAGPAIPRTATVSYEIKRGEAHVSITDVPGVIKSEDVSTGGTFELTSSFVSGRCSGQRTDCVEVEELMKTASSLDDLVAKLQGAGFSIVQQSKCKTGLTPTST